MSERLRLVIGNKNYSSWSLRPWLALRMAGIAFEEELVRFGLPDWKSRILAISPAGKVPILVHERAGETITIWDSLAICGYAARLAPKAGLWPKAEDAYAFCASVACEMHSGFGALRSAMPMNVKKDLHGKGMGPGVQADIDRITAIWRQGRERFGAGGPFLLGAFTIADAMFAPVVSRFTTYGVALDPVAAAYRDAVQALEPMREWTTASKAEPWTVPEDEID